MCEDFARERLAVYPQDIEQRVEDGLGSVLSVLGGPCDTFQFAELLEAADLTSPLPVLFSSDQFTSPALVDTTFPLIPTQTPPLRVDEYWYGKSAFSSENTMCARVGLITYYFNRYFNEWYDCSKPCAYKSVPDVCLQTVEYPTFTYVNLQQKNGTTSLGNVPGVVTACQLSGDGKAFFVRDATGWKRHRGTTQWEPIGKTGAAFADLELHTSFDGDTFVQSKPSSSEYYYKIGSRALNTKQLEEESKDAVLSTVLDQTIFIARGNKLHSVGSLNLERVVFELRGADALIVSLWADAKTLWLSTNTGTFMSNDASWAWTELKNVFAIGPGLLAKPGSGTIWQNSDESFVEAVGYPLRLTNGGLLYNDVNGWANAYEDQTMNAQFTTIQASDSVAWSPNGQYLVTQQKGRVRLYLNVWNSDTFSAWCKEPGHDCKAARAKYCLDFKGDPGCRANPPESPESAPDVKEGFPTLGIVLISIAVLGLIGALLFALRRKSKQTPIST